MQKLADNIYILVLLGTAGIALLIIGFILLQVHNQNKVLLQKRKLQDAEIHYQKELLHAVIASQETERKRIGMDLHDEVGASLSLLRLMVENHQSESNADPEESSFYRETKSSIDTVINSVRNISHDLSPRLDGKFGLYDVLLDLSDKVNSTPGLTMEVILNEESDAAVLPAMADLSIYRIIKELVNNTMKHARASQVHLSMGRSTGFLLIRYRDNGKGIPENTGRTSQGIGLKNIESRLGMLGATWALLPNLETGYGMEIKIPLKEQQ